MSDFPLGDVISNTLAFALPEAVVKAATRTLWSKQWLRNLQLLRLLHKKRPADVSNEALVEMLLTRCQRLTPQNSVNIGKWQGEDTPRHTD